MNKFIIFPCFFIVVSFHILFFFYYKKYEIISPAPIKNKSIQLQISKVKEIKEKIVEQKTEQKKEIIKNPIQKKETPKETLKKIPKTENIEKKEIQKEKTQKAESLEEKKIIEEIPTPDIEKATTEEKIDIQKKIDKYAIKLREEINKNKNYPNISRKLKEEGKVIVSFRVLSNGQFTNITILSSSNKERLDKAALNALYDTKEFEPFDKNINKEFLDFELPLEFTLY